METKRRWALHHINAWGEPVPWERFTFTARGRTKAAKKLMRRLERHPGVLLLVDMQPDAFALERRS